MQSNKIYFKKSTIPGDAALIPGLGRSPGGGNGNPTPVLKRKRKRKHTHTHTHTHLKKGVGSHERAQNV